MIVSLKKIKNKLLLKMRFFGLSKKEVFRNTLTNEMAEEICMKLNNAFPNGNFDTKQVQEAAGLFNNIKRSIIGRIGNDVDDYVINYFMRQAAAKEFKLLDNIAQVEIGVFFASGIIMMLNALKNADCRHVVIGIDPLNGYYISDNSEYSCKRDILTDLPIDLVTVKKNIIKCGFNPDNIIFVDDYSQSEKALEAVSKYRIASIYIDGDHSYKGLKRDFDNYFKYVLPGGYILIDNYKDSHGLNHFWPDVTKFIECELIPFNESFRIILIHNRCVLLKKIK